MDSKKKIKNRLDEVNRLLAEMDGAKSVNEIKIGELLNIKFRDITLSLRKIGINIYEAISKGDSIKIKEGDLLKIKDEDLFLQPGEKISFEIFRKAMDYQTDPIEGIK